MRMKRNRNRQVLWISTGGRVGWGCWYSGMDASNQESSRACINAVGVVVPMSHRCMPSRWVACDL